MPSSGCLNDETVLALVGGRLAAPVVDRVEAHLVACAECRTIVAETAGANESTDPPLSLDTAMTTYGADMASERPPLQPGARVGRYEVLELIGVGGMGTVYAANDPELHRRVALKVLRTSVLASDRGGDLQARLLREARLMAQLSHPNVVTVFDAGTHEGQVFVAMELVHGSTLRRWLKMTSRTSAEIVAAFSDAGLGMAAAHRIGLVHRDFKPENVLVATDGRVRVTDFGLAREIESVTPVPGDPAAVVPRATTTGLAGTPAYMAPEQLGGHAADPRSDQFSFCVALHEALYGERPFVGLSVDGVERTSRAGVSIAPALRALIRRGLAPRPEDRHASMDDLLVSLGDALPDPARRRPRGRAIVAVTVLLATAGIVSAAIYARSTDREVVAEPRDASAVPVIATPRIDTPVTGSAPSPPPPVASDPPRVSKPRAKKPPAPPAAKPQGSNASIRVGDGLRDPFAPSK